MIRIFFSLAVVALVLLAVNLLIGLSIGDYNSAAQAWLDSVAEVRRLEHQRRGADGESLAAARQRQQELNQSLAPQRQRVRWHWLFGLAASLVTILVNSVTVTYFIGTSRWCKEVGDAYSLAPELAARSAQLKRRTFPWALGSMLVIVGIVALGASSEPGNSLVEQPASWVHFHLAAALVGVCLILLSFFVQAHQIHANSLLVQQMMDEVRRIRSDRGLDVAPADVASSIPG
ncbi:MAG: hypothetical protein U0935_01295 [Pirellulales bacterium]